MVIGSTVPIVKKAKREQEKQKMYYDRGSRNLGKLEPGDVVRMQLGKTWQPEQS